VVSLSGTGTRTSYQVDLSWSAPSSSADPVAGYNVYRSTSGSSAFQLLNASVDTQTTYVDTAVQNDFTYDYYVESVDAFGITSVPSTTITVEIP
jgi:fibronectin type 3 domain-containing protein